MLGDLTIKKPLPQAERGSESARTGRTNRQRTGRSCNRGDAHSSGCRTSSDGFDSVAVDEEILVVVEEELAIAMHPVVPEMAPSASSDGLERQQIDWHQRSRSAQAPVPPSLQPKPG